MHELSIIAQTVNTIEKLAAENHFGRITKVTLEIGKMRAAVPDLLRDAFRDLSKGTIYEGAALEIWETDVDLECSACGRHIDREESLLHGCPACGSHRIRLLSGNEVKIRRMEGTQAGRMPNPECEK